MPSTKSGLRDGGVLTVAMLLPLGMAILYFIVLDDPGDHASRALSMAFAIGKAIQFLIPVLYVWWFDRAEIGMPRPTVRGIPVAVGFSVAVGLAMFALYFLWVKDIPAVATDTPRRIHDKVRQFHADSPLRFLMLALAISVVHSLAEEYYWRWFVYGRLRKHVPTPWANVISSIGFMLHHVVILGVYFPGHFWTLALPFSVCVAVGGGVWAWIYERSESLFGPWLSHCLIDGAIMGVGFVMLKKYWY